MRLQAHGPSSAFPAPEQQAGAEVEQPGLIGDAGIACSHLTTVVTPLAVTFS